jgi:hypothetical protein
MERRLPQSLMLIPHDKGPNQAMQLTAPRSVSPLRVAKTSNSQLHSLPGAVADLCLSLDLMRRCVFLILLLVARPAWAGASQAPPLFEDEAIRKMLSTRVDLQKHATGIVIGVIDSKGSHIISYGEMGLSDKRPVNGDTVFDVRLDH